MLSKVKYFYYKQQKARNSKTPKQILQILPIALVQVKAISTSESLVNEIRQNICSLCRAKKVTKNA